LEQQLIYNLPALFIWPVGLYQLTLGRQYRNYRFIGIGILAALAVFVIGNGKGYYGMPAYPLMIAFGAVCVERWVVTRPAWLRYSLISFSILTGLFINSASLPFLPPKQLAAWYANHPLYAKLYFLQWEDQKDHPLPQDFADMLAWHEMTRKVAALYYSMSPAEQQKTIIDCDSYGEAGAIDYYGPQYRLKPVMCHAASFLFWTDMGFNKNDNFILVTDSRNEIHADFVKNFVYAAIADSITNPNAREFGSYIILLKKPNAGFRKEWKDDYEKWKKESAFIGR
jgi:hypothetical protein